MLGRSKQFRKYKPLRKIEVENAIINREVQKNQAREEIIDLYISEEE